MADAPEKTILFVPLGARLEVKYVDAKLAIVFVDGCKVKDLRIHKGDLEIELKELSHGAILSGI